MKLVFASGIITMYWYTGVAFVHPSSGWILNGNLRCVYIRVIRLHDIADCTRAHYSRMFGRDVQPMLFFKCVDW